MTAIAVLAEAHARGVVLIPERENLRIKGRVTPALRDRLVALKPELLALLLEDRRAASARAWSAAYGRLSGMGWPGREVLQRLFPLLLGEIDRAETDAERLTIAYRTGEGDGSAYVQALGHWEALVRDVAAELGRVCHDCGRDTPAALMDPHTGERFCKACVRV